MYIIVAFGLCYTVVELLLRGLRRSPVRFAFTSMYKAGLDRQYKCPIAVQTFNTVATLHCLCDRKYSTLTIHGVQQHTKHATVIIGNSFAFLYERVMCFPKRVSRTCCFTVYTIILLQYMMTIIGNKKNSAILNHRDTSLTVGDIML